jgi:hypothetical protein
MLLLLQLTPWCFYIRVLCILLPDQQTLLLEVRRNKRLSLDL